MSEQIKHKIHYRGKTYEILDGEGSLLVMPQDYGIWPGMVSTACGRGYWHEYAVDDGKLFWKTLYVHAFDDQYPVINGVTPVVDEITSHHVYQDLHIRLSLTGSMLIGFGCFRRFRYRMDGYEEAWWYHKVYELHFENGILTEVKAMHSEMEAIRRKVCEELDIPNPDEENLHRRDIEDYY